MDRERVPQERDAWGRRLAPVAVDPVVQRWKIRLSILAGRAQVSPWITRAMLLGIDGAKVTEHLSEPVELPDDGPPLLLSPGRCYGWRCGGSGWLECWCGLCGEEQCYGCRDCRDEVDAGERCNADEGDDCDAL
jgi:hypothetical protein